VRSGCRSSKIDRAHLLEFEGSDRPASPARFGRKKD
jgi:hypothetical protein